MADLRPQLPAGFPSDVTIDVNDAGYKATRAVAHESGMSQAQFSNMLGMAARSVMERRGIAAPINEMSFAEKMQASAALAEAKRR